MPEQTVAEPSKTDLPNPVIKEEFADAKAVFRKQMETIAPAKEPETETDAPIEPPQPPKEAPPTAPPSDDGEKPRVLPDDVLEPKPKEEEASSTIAELEALTLPKNAKPEKVTAFEGLKKKAIADLTAAESRIKELESKISSSTSNVETEKLNEKLKAAEQKAAEIEDQWAKVALETSPQFQRQFVKREQAALAAAKSYLEGSEIDARIVDYAARISGPGRLKILEEAGLDPKQIGAIEARLAQYDSIQSDKIEAVDNWRQQGAAWQEAEQKRIQDEQAKRSEFENKVWEKVVQKNSNLLPFRSSKDETWNSQGEQFRNEAREVFLGKGADPETMADIVQRGVVARAGFYDKIIDHLTKENKLKDERIAKLESAAPGGGITTTAGEKPATDASKISREELSKLTFNEQMAQARGG